MRLDADFSNMLRFQPSTMEFLFQTVKKTGSLPPEHGERYIYSDEQARKIVCAVWFHTGSLYHPEVYEYSVDSYTWGCLNLFVQLKTLGRPR